MIVGDSCTTLSMYLMPFECILKNSGKFYMYFTTIFKSPLKKKEKIPSIHPISCQYMLNSLWRCHCALFLFLWNVSQICVSSLYRGNANLLCIILFFGFFFSIHATEVSTTVYFQENEKREAMIMSQYYYENSFDLTEPHKTPGHTWRTTALNYAMCGN